MARNYNETRLPAAATSATGGHRQPARLRFDRGSLLLDPGAAEALHPLPGYLIRDERVGAFRCLAIHYRALVRELVRRGIAHEDRARGYDELALETPHLPEPYPFQAEALAAWRRGKRGTLELPTGAGKTQVALAAIAEVGRGTLVLAPTLDLVAQWCESVQRQLGIAPGMVGGGSFQLAPVTVSTYASAYRHGAGFGHRFGLAVFDECHHLAAEGYRDIAEQLIAPYRLGLSATLERPDGAHRVLDELIGPRVYARGITELSGRYLADYTVHTVHAELSEAERRDYGEARETYLEFARERGIAMSSRGDWRRFVFAASRSPEGREALAAFYRQKAVAYTAQAKFRICADLLRRHRDGRVLIFSNDNATAYAVSRRFLLPIITHRTRLAERREILAHFRDNRWPAVVTSRVLNEGVDVPAAGVAVILSGTSSVREHVQRLGRVLRKHGDKRAVLYEVLTRGTAEEGTSRRRRQHDAYR